jgi:hypothetical protein
MVVACNVAVDAGEAHAGWKKMTLRVKQESEARKTDWWSWSIWLEGDKKELDEVDHVVYTLHSTFPDPVRVVKDRRTGFKLQSVGWGEFEIYLRIVLKNGKSRTRKHWLALSQQPVRQRAAPSKFAATDQSSSRDPPTSNESEQIARPPVAFISSSAADSALAREVSALLETRGFKVVSSGHGKPGVPWSVSLDDMLRSANAAVFLLSGRPSLWTYNEIEHVLAHEIPHIVPVLIGSDAEVPPRLESFTAIHLDSGANAANLAERLMGAAEESGWLPSG